MADVASGSTRCPGWIAVGPVAMAPPSLGECRILDRELIVPAIRWVKVGPNFLSVSEVRVRANWATAARRRDGCQLHQMGHLTSSPS
jgi:hypothetical protein